MIFLIYMIFSPMTTLASIQKSCNGLLDETIFRKTENLYSHARNVRNELGLENLNAANNLLMTDLQSPSAEGKNLGVSSAVAKQILSNVKNHPVSGMAQVEKYDPSGCIGYCFGRAFSTQLESYKLGISQKALIKIWAVGNLRIRGEDFFSHVTTAIRSEVDGSFLILDTRFDEPLSPAQWYRLVKTWTKDVKEFNLVFFATTPQRMTVNGEPYADFLNYQSPQKYFLALIEDFKLSIQDKRKRAGP